ncbi:MAG: hypothetical protein V1820_05265 [archaeon]
MAKGRKSYEGVFFSKILLGLAIVLGIFMFAKKGLGLWTAALLALIIIIYAGFADPTSTYAEEKYKVK